MNGPSVLHHFFSYPKFLLKSTNQHGVHSPFVYNLVTKCFYDKKSYSSYRILQKYRKSLLSNKKRIKVTDFGAGSRFFSSEKRKVSDIAKNAGITSKRARLLNRLVKYFKIRNALELGTSVGLGATAIAAENHVQVTTIEGCPATATIAKQQFEKFHLQNITLVVAEFEETLDELINKLEISNSKTENPNSKFKISKPIIHNRKQKTENREPTTENAQPPQPTTRKTENRPPPTENQQPTTDHPQLIFIDGNHKKEATLKYFEKLLNIACNDSVFIFDDIHWSAGMEEAWEEIKKHPAITVTIDTYFWGFVFFRKEQEKEHFAIRL